MGVHYLRRETFCDATAALRTDDSFRARRDPKHHNGESPLESIGTGMVSQCRLDPFHLIYIGVFKRFVEFLLGKKKLPALLSVTEINELSSILDRTAKYVPYDFNRRPKNFEYLEDYKGTEFRRLLICDGLVIFSKIKPRFRKCFLLLHAGIYILASPKLIKMYIDSADLFLRRFVKKAEKVFGKQFVVYCVHSAIHLADECRDHGCLEDFSAFRYENHLGVIRKILRSTYKPIQQLANRDKERGGRWINPKDHLGEGEIKLTEFHRKDIEGEHFLSIKLGGKSGTQLRVTEADCGFKTKNGEVAILKDVVRSPEGNVILFGQKFLEMSGYYDFPCQSSLLGINKVSSLDPNETKWQLSDYEEKCAILPCPVEKNCCVSIPILHCSC